VIVIKGRLQNQADPNTGTGGNSPDVFRMVVDAGGLTLLDNGPSDLPSYYQTEMKYRNGKLYFGSGSVMNPATWTMESDFPVAGISMDLVGGTNLVAFLANDSISYSVAHAFIFSYPARQQLRQIDFNVSGYPFANLTWCGADRFAFRSTSELIFFRSSAIASSDLRLSGSQSTNAVAAGDTVTLQLTVSNSGPNNASSVFLTNAVPAGVDIVSCSVSQGTVTTNGNYLIAALGTVSASGGDTMTAVLSPAATAIGWITNIAEVASANPADPVLFNNRLQRALLVLPFAPPTMSGVDFDDQLIVRYAGPDGRYAYFDTHLVRTLPETILVLLAADGRIRRIDILSFEEPEDYMPTERWLQQFPGRGPGDELNA